MTDNGLGINYSGGTAKTGKTLAPLYSPNLSPDWYLLYLLVNDLSKPHSSAPNKISAFLQKNIRFEDEPLKPGQAELHKYPWATLKEKEGDCDDQALFACYFLQQAGYETKLVEPCISIIENGQRITKGHVVCAYREKNAGNWAYLDIKTDHRGIFKIAAKDFRQVANDTLPGWEKARVWTVVYTKDTQVITKSSFFYR